MGEFKRIAAVSEIPEGSFKAFEVDFERIVVAHTEDGLFCLTDECTHDSEPISSGFLKRNELICKRHGARFDVRTGAVTRAPAVVGLDTYEVKVDGDDVYVKLD
jgi:3-phenylpropionate/trans-cinnamate dioxygenase ferredoxin subunit